MAIREVKEMPENVSKALKESDRDMVLRDFNEALDNHVEIFEFDGDYNYKTLSQKAKEVAQRKVFYWIYYDVKKKVEKVLAKEFPEEKYLTAYDYSYYRDRFCKIKNVKEDDRIHVYVSIDFKFLDNLYDTVLADTRLHYKLKGEQKDE